MLKKKAEPEVKGKISIGDEIELNFADPSGSNKAKVLSVGLGDTYYKVQFSEGSKGLVYPRDIKS